MGGISSRIFRGFLANGFGHGITVVTQLVSVPLMLTFWGSHLYGEWLVLNAIPSYLAMSDFGFGSVAANEMTMLVSRNNKMDALKVFQSVFWLVCLLSLVIAIALFIALRYIPLRDWLHLIVLSYPDMVESVLILALGVLIGLQDTLVEAGFRCDGNYVEGTFLLNARRLVESIGLFTAIYFGGGIVIAAATMTVIRLAGFILLRMRLKLLSPWVVYGLSHANITELKRLAIPAFAFMAFPLGNALVLQGMVIAISVTLGPAVLVAFSVVRTISRIALQLMGLINASVWPELSRAFGSGNLELVRKLHRVSSQISFWLTSLMIIFLLATGNWLIRIWTHGKVEVDHVFFGIMMAVIFANSFWFTSSVVLVSVNKHQHMAGLYLTGACIALLLASILLPRIGLDGAAISLFSIDAFMAWYVLSSSLAITEDELSKFIKNLVRPQLSSLAMALRGQS